MANGPNGVDLLFVYGILKRGHVLDLEDRGCEFVGRAYIAGAVLHNLGGGVGLRLSGDKAARGEVFRITDHKLWEWLDVIEGNGRTYTREVKTVLVPNIAGQEQYEAWVYVHTYYPAEDYKDIPIFENGIFPRG